MSRSTLKIRNWIWPVNRLYDLDYSLNLSVLLVPHDHKWMIINGAIRMQMGTWSLTVTRFFFFCVQLAGWSSRCAVCALAPTGSNKFLFLGRSCKDPHRIFGHIGQDKRAIPLLFSLCWEYVANTNMICVYQKKLTIIAAFITIRDIHLPISFMASIIVWSWITIHVYSDLM